MGNSDGTRKTDLGERDEKARMDARSDTLRQYQERAHPRNREREREREREI